jgi:Flp pilus assembly protein TadG
MSVAFPSSARRQRGIAAVELGILLTLLTTMVFGITEFGRAMYQYDTLTKSARAASRFLSVYDASDAVVRTRAACIAVFGTPGCTGAPLIPNLTTANVQALDPTTDATLQGVAVFGGVGTMDMVQVTISGYQFVSLVPFVVPNMAFGPIVARMPQSFF